MRQPSQQRQNVTNLLHDLFCGYNYEEGCSWYYENCRGENQRWTQPTHARYLDVADELLLRFNDAKSTMTSTLRWLTQFRSEGKL